MWVLCNTHWMATEPPSGVPNTNDLGVHRYDKAFWIACLANRSIDYSPSESTTATIRNRNAGRTYARIFGSF